MYNISIETNIISIMILITVFFSLRKQVTGNEKTTTILMYLLWFTIGALIANSARVLFDGNQTVVGNLFLHLATFLDYVMIPIIVFVWFYYVVTYVFNSRSIQNILFKVFGVMIFAHTLLALLSIKGHYLFMIDENSVYSRGPMFLVTVVVVFTMVFLCSFYIIYHRKMIKKGEFLALLLFGLPPAIAAIIQITSPIFSIIGPSLAISILMIFIYVQSRIANTDFLTGLSNRRDYENHLIALEQKKHRNYKLGGIVIDIDNFKKINDDYGHDVGDEVLVKIGEILRTSVRKDDFVARLGGDEFAISILHLENEVVEEVVNRISNNIKKYNQEHSNEYQIVLSIGYGIYDKKKTPSVASFYIHLDNKMYQEKARNVEMIRAKQS